MVAIHSESWTKLAGQTHKISTSTSNNSNQETDSEKETKRKKLLYREDWTTKGTNTSNIII